MTIDKMELLYKRVRHLTNRLDLCESALHLIADQTGNPDTEDFDIVRRECYGWSMCALKNIPIESRYDWTRFDCNSGINWDKDPN